MTIVSSSYLIILVLGIVAALANLQSIPDIKQKKLLFQIIFYIGIFTQIATQGLQYLNASGRHKDLDRQFAYALFAYTRDDPKLLKDFASDTPYVIGYRLFKDNPPNFDAARYYFDKSIDKGQFVASSYYMLATIERIQHPNDFTAAKRLFGKAIESDAKYAGAYYGRALTEVNMEASAALDDLWMSLKYEEGDLICITINDPVELEKYWKTVTSNAGLNERFKEFQAGCMKH